MTQSTDIQRPSPDRSGLYIRAGILVPVGLVALLSHVSVYDEGRGRDITDCPTTMAYVEIESLGNTSHDIIVRNESALELLAEANEGMAGTGYDKHDREDQSQRDAGVIWDADASQNWGHMIYPGFNDVATLPGELACTKRDQTVLLGTGQFAASVLTNNFSEPLPAGLEMGPELDIIRPIND